MGRVKEAYIEQHNLHTDFALLITTILISHGYELLTEQQIGPDGGADYVAKMPASDETVAIELKLYRSQRTNPRLLEHAVLRLEAYIQKQALDRGLLITSTTITPDQRGMFLSKSGSVEIWDTNDLLERTKYTPELHNELVRFLKSIQIDTLGDQALLLSEIAEERLVAPPVPAGAALAQKLEASSAGKSKKAAKEFEKLCEEALRLMFARDFAGWNAQARIDHGFHKMDLVARLTPDATFWVNVAHDFRTRYVVFEFKNYKGAITQSEVYTTEKYLFTSALRAVAVIVARSGISESATKAMNGALREQGKLILGLGLLELCDMLRGFDAGDDPTNILIQKLDDMLTSIAR